MTTGATLRLGQQTGATLNLGALAALAAAPRRAYVSLGSLSGDSLVQANTIVNALQNKWSTTQRDIAEAVARGELDRARLAEVDALQSELEALTGQIFEIDTPQIGPWISWSQDIDRRLSEIRVRNADAIESVRRIRATRVGVGFLVAAGLAAGVGALVWRNRKKAR